MAHALLSPSSASRWLACTPSARYEAQFPDSTSEAAKEGTLAHALCELNLKVFLRSTTKAAAKKERARIEADPLYSNEMSDHAAAYAAFVIEKHQNAVERTKDAFMGVEVLLDLTSYVPEAFGTGDAVIVADGVLDVIDFKYGKGVEVSAIANKQMMLYALGALDRYAMLYDISTVRMTIYQPRLDNISEYEMSVSELIAWGEAELRPRARLAFDGEGEYVSGKHCQFCRGKVRCRAFGHAIAACHVDDANIMTDSELAATIPVAEAITSWLTAAKDYMLDEALRGHKFEGFKLVEGRSNRAYSDEKQVADIALAQGFSEEDIYNKKLLGITGMERLLGKAKFRDLLSDLVVKPQGKPALVLDSDKRPEWQPADSAESEFKEN